MPKIKVQIDRDASGIPSIATIRRGRKKLKIDFSPDTGFIIEGSSKSLPSFSEIAGLIYPVQPVTVVAEKGTETRIYRTKGSVPKNEEKILCDLVGLDVTLEHLELSSNSKNSAPVLKPYKKDGVLDDPLSLLTYDGSDYSYATHSFVHSFESILWLELMYDTTNDRYKLGLGYPLRFANGVKISVLNADITAAKDIGCVASVLIRG